VLVIECWSQRLTAGAAAHDHGLAAGDADRGADQDRDGGEHEVVAGGGDAVQVGGDGDRDDDQRAQQLADGEGRSLICSRTSRISAESMR
jgi:hypothetical protein